jgi:hypothetical protein
MSNTTKSGQKHHAVIDVLTARPSISFYGLSP